MLPLTIVIPPRNLPVIESQGEDRAFCALGHAYGTISLDLLLPVSIHIPEKKETLKQRS